MLFVKPAYHAMYKYHGHIRYQHVVLQLLAEAMPTSMHLLMT